MRDLSAPPTRRTTLLVAAAVVLQVLVPAIVLVGTSALGWERPARGGWQMYSAEGSSRDIQVEFADGRIEDRSLDDLGVHRRDIHATARTLRWLCGSIEDAIALVGGGGAVRSECP